MANPIRTIAGEISLAIETAARVENGALVLNSKRYDTPSAAAMSITGGPANGWTFWECRMPGQAGWHMIKALRKTIR